MSTGNKQSRIRSKQRQKLRRRTILIVAASFVLLLTASLTIFFHFSNIDRSTAGTGQGFSGQYLIEEQTFVTDMTLPEPLVSAKPAPGKNVLMVRPIKKASETAPPSQR